MNIILATDRSQLRLIADLLVLPLMLLLFLLLLLSSLLLRLLMLLCYYQCRC